VENGFKWRVVCSEGCGVAEVEVGCNGGWGEAADIGLDIPPIDDRLYIGPEHSHAQPSRTRMHSCTRPTPHPPPHTLTHAHAHHLWVTEGTNTCQPHSHS
jgi:hypothetical protein